MCGLPTTVRLRHADCTLVLEGGAGAVAIPYDRLRAECRCASCRRARLDGRPAATSPGVTIAEARPMGASALQLVFSDGHDRGIFPFTFLMELARRVS